MACMTRRSAIYAQGVYGTAIHPITSLTATSSTTMVRSNIRPQFLPYGFLRRHHNNVAYTSCYNFQSIISRIGDQRRLQGLNNIAVARDYGGFVLADNVQGLDFEKQHRLWQRHVWRRSSTGIPAPGRAQNNFGYSNGSLGDFCPTCTVRPSNTPIRTSPTRIPCFQNIPAGNFLSDLGQSRRQRRRLSFSGPKV